MKIKENVIPIILIFFIVVSSSIFTITYKNELIAEKEHTYSGTVIDRLYETPTNEHKSLTNAKYYIIMKDDSINKVIKVLVTVPTYYVLKKGDKASFRISNYKMYFWGNITDPSQNPYKQ